MAVPSLSVTALGGSDTPSWNLTESYNGVELNGIVKGRLGYAVGVNAGANLGGMSLDGEDSQGSRSAARPWAENALTLGAFFYRSRSRFGFPDGETETDVAFNWAAAPFPSSRRVIKRCAIDQLR